MTDFDDGPDTNPDADKTPVGPPGSCWRCERIDAVFIVAPAPGSRYEAERLPTCICTKDWSWCAVTFFLRLGKHDFYLGPNRRENPREVPADPNRRRLPPPFPPRQDDGG